MQKQMGRRQHIKYQNPKQNSNSITLMMRYFDRKHQAIHSNYGLNQALTHTFNELQHKLHSIVKNRAKTLLFVQGIGRIGILN